MADDKKFDRGGSATMEVLDYLGTDPAQRKERRDFMKGEDKDRLARQQRETHYTADIEGVLQDARDRKRNNRKRAGRKR